MLTSIRNKNLVVTGASSGIGRAFAFVAAAEGANLLLSGRNLERLEEVASLCLEKGANQVEIVVADLAKLEDLDVLIAEITAMESVDALIHCAGLGSFDHFYNLSQSDMNQMIDLNLKASMYLVQKTAISMLDQGFGQLMVVASVAGMISTAKSTVYSASKAGLIAFMDALRLELYQTPIKVTTVNPGPVDSSFFSRDDRNKAYYHNIQKISLNPQRLAQAMLKALKKQQRDLVMPAYFRPLHVFYTAFPNLGDRITAHFGSLK